MLFICSNSSSVSHLNIIQLNNHKLYIYVLQIFIFLAAMCLLATICCGVWESLVGYDFQVTIRVLLENNFIFLAAMCLLATICCGVWESLVGYDFQVTIRVLLENNNMYIHAFRCWLITNGWRRCQYILLQLFEMTSRIFAINLYLYSGFKVTRHTYAIITSVYVFKFQSYLPWEDFVPGTFLEGGEDGSVAEGSTVIALMVFFSYVIVLNTVVPISLYVR